MLVRHFLPHLAFGRLRKSFTAPRSTGWSNNFLHVVTRWSVDWVASQRTRHRTQFCLIKTKLNKIRCSLLKHGRNNERSGNLAKICGVCDAKELTCRNAYCSQCVGYCSPNSFQPRPSYRCIGPLHAARITILYLNKVHKRITSPIMTSSRIVAVCNAGQFKVSGIKVQLVKPSYILKPERSVEKSVRKIIISIYWKDRVTAKLVHFLSRTDSEVV